MGNGEKHRNGEKIWEIGKTMRSWSGPLVLNTDTSRTARKMGKIMRIGGKIWEMGKKHGNREKKHGKQGEKHGKHELLEKPLSVHH